MLIKILLKTLSIRFVVMKSENEKKDLSFLGHLEELRWRLVRSSIVILVSAVVLFYFTDPIVNKFYINMSSTSFPTYKFFCLLSQKLNISDALCASEIPIQIQSIEMTKQFSTNMYFALIGGLIIQVGSIMIDTSIKNKLQKIESRFQGGRFTQALSGYKDPTTNIAIIIRELEELSGV